MASTTDRSGKPSHHLLSWLRHVSTCHFARAFASHASGLLVADVTNIRQAAAVDAFELSLANAHLANQALLCVFDFDTSPLDLFKFTHALEKYDSARWRISSLPHDDGVELRLVHRPSGGPESTAMGFGPFHTMPVTRRAPVAAIGVWAGGFQNPLFSRDLEGGRQRKAASFADMPHGMNRKPHDATWKKTEADSMAAAGAVIPLRRMTFRLPL